MPMVLCEPCAEASKRKVVLSTGGSFAASYTSPLYSELQIRFGSGLWNTRIRICSGHLQAEVSDPDLV